MVLYYNITSSYDDKNVFNVPVPNTVRTVECSTSMIMIHYYCVLCTVSNKNIPDMIPARFFIFFVIFLSVIYLRPPLNVLGPHILAHSHIAPTCIPFAASCIINPACPYMSSQP